MTRSYFLMGKVDTGCDAWIRMTDVVEKIIQTLGRNADSFFILRVDHDDDRSLKTLNGLRRKILRAKERNEKIKAMEVAALPENYRNMIFDYIYTFDACDNHVMLTVNDEYMPYPAPEMEEEIIEILRDGIEATGGQVFEMDIGELPTLYMSSLRRNRQYRTLKIIREFT